MVENALGHGAIDALDLLQICHARARHRTGRAKVMQQRLLALGADTGDLIQDGAELRLATPASLTNKNKQTGGVHTVFVTDLEGGCVVSVSVAVLVSAVSFAGHNCLGRAIGQDRCALTTPVELVALVMHHTLIAMLASMLMHSSIEASFVARCALCTRPPIVANGALRRVEALRVPSK